MGQERRAYPRRPVHWEAAVTGDGLSEQKVTIRDFCAGGLFLEYHASDPLPSASAPLPEMLEIRFEDPSSGENCHCQGRVIRDTGHGIAIAFDGPELNVVTILSAVAQGQSSPRRNGVSERVGSELRQEVISVCRQEAIAFAERVLPIFAGHAIDALKHAARDAGTHHERTQLETCYVTLRQRENELVSSYVAELSERMAAMPSQPTAVTDSAGADEAPSSIADLELVDHDDFEDWLNRSEIVNQAEYLFHGELERLTRRLSYVAGRRLDEQTNPLSPSGLTDILAISLPLEGLAHQASRTLYRLFGRYVLEQLGQPYEKLNKMLREREILPDLEKERPEIRSLGGSQRSQWIRRSHAEEVGYSGGLFRALNRPDAFGSLPEGLAQGRLTEPLQALDACVDSEPSSAEHTAAKGSSDASLVEANASPEDRERETSKSSRWLGIQRTLRHAHEAASRRPVARPAQASSPAPEPTTEVVETRLHQAAAGAPAVVSNAPVECDSGERPTLQRLLARLDVDGLNELAESTREAVEVIADWFEDIATNPVSAVLLRDWSRSLAEVALDHHDAFLSDERCPIHDLLDQWDRAAIALEAVPVQHRSGLRQRIDRVLDDVTQRSGDDQAIIADAASQISALVDAPLEARAANLQRITEKYEGSKRLEQARANVDDALNERLAGLRIPAPLNQFIRGYWHHVLVLIRLGSGANSEHWQRALAVVDRLMKLLGTGDEGGRAVPDHDKVFAFIDKQLNAFGRNSPECEQLLARMKRHADAVCAGHAPEQALPFERVAAMSQQSATADHLDPYWLGVVKLLRPGQWVRIHEARHGPQVRRLQWINDGQTRFVFADYAGEQSVEYSWLELTSAMAAAKVELTNTLDASLSERQWHRKLHAAHDAIIDLATHDNATGLLNRKALIRELDRIEESRRGGRGDHALVAFRLTTAEGDGSGAPAANFGLTPEIADELRNALGEDDRLARTDTSGLVALLADRTVARAEVAAEELRRELARRLTAANGDAPVVVSAGLIGFQFGALQQPSELIKEAEVVAAEAADDGRASVVTRRAEQREMSALRDNMKRAARLDAALEAGDLKLRAQRIQPLQRVGPKREQMREILIAVGSGEDDEQLLSPAQFIPAAEQFGRMASVDRWVIRRVLEWCRDNPRQASGVGAFTINLAGATLSDNGLVDYLTSEFARTGVAPETICFELSETVAVQNLARVADLVTQVRQMGCHFALDDVGTGYGADHYLANLPADFIKIDGSFIRHIVEDETDAAIVSSINELAHYLGKKTIAEYVENEAILERLEAIGIDYVQGYGVGYPEPLDRLPVV
jgi:EAL domain-containing protein (putative c-di-GMP-specific phosphodiesterase class I)/GGDEF domain-containing protein